MSSKSGIPDAWDDDWETLADRPEPKSAQPESAPKLTKAQRRAQHNEQQRQLWDSAENPDRFHWLEAQGVEVPLKQEYKPQVKLLSRKPAAPVIAKKGALDDGVAKLSLEDGGEDSEDEARRKQESEMEERQRKAKIEREEKQRKYAEARERIMGSPSAVTPAPNSRESSHGRDNRRSRGGLNGSRNSQPTSADQSPARAPNGDKQLFDPDDMSRRLPKRDTNVSTRDQEPSRQPRGPESGGRGGFGFAARGGRGSS